MAIYESIMSGELTGVNLDLVVSNNSTSGALDFAKRKGITSKHLSIKSCGDDADVLTEETLRGLWINAIDMIVLAGYMKKLPEVVVKKYAGRILNVHPALLPDFGGSGMFGMNVHHAVIQASRVTSGATVHLVEGDYDKGKIVLQETCPVYESDTAEVLAGRVTAIEHKILPRAIKILSDSIVNTQ